MWMWRTHSCAPRSPSCERYGEPYANCDVQFGQRVAFSGMLV